MKIAELQNKNILIVGYGKEGKATEAFLKKFAPSSTITIADAIDGPDYLQNQAQFDLAIKSPGIHAELLSIPYTTATNIFFANVAGMTIGITGTKGKSTTTSLIYAILREAGKKAHLVGNIGNPMLAELLVSNTKDDVWVCELSSYQLSDIHYSPHIAVMVSLFPEHMNYHGSVEVYYKAKAHIVAYTTKHDYFVYNADFPKLCDIAKNTKAQAIPFVDTLPFPESSIPLIGKHNRDNVRLAVTVAKILHIPDNVIEQAVKNFQPLPHRLQKVGTFNGITFYDDAISTTPESTIKAIEALPNIGTLFLGGQNRGYDFSELVKVILEYKIPNIVLFSESGEAIKTAFTKKTKTVPNIYITDNNKDAIIFAYSHTKPGQICLMSPASPSYTLWKSFEKRGDEFQELVKEYAENNLQS